MEYIIEYRMYRYGGKLFWSAVCNDSHWTTQQGFWELIAKVACDINLLIV